LILPDKIKAVEEIFLELDREIVQFQSESGLHCKAGCGKCCFKADIEATILEFLPFAAQVYREGRASDWMARLAESNSPVCHILNPEQGGVGLCTRYSHRGLICRLFGFSARTNKYGKNELVTCQIIKSEQSEAFKKSEDRIRQGQPVPVMNQYYMKLYSIDPDLAAINYPINLAIKKAFETVLHYYSYRPEEGPLPG
jgi:Fe-S-cluster containining protein